MDSLTAAAARALAAGDPVGALGHVSLRDDAPALALRGIAMAQLGELPRARELLRRAARAFGPAQATARARCVVAEAEVALALRDLAGLPRGLAAATDVLDARGDAANARQARLIAMRRLLLLGRLDAAADVLASLDRGPLAPPQRAVAELAAAELAMRALDTGAARRALDVARASAERARIPALAAEVAEAAAALQRPVARLRQGAVLRPLRLDEVEHLEGSGDLILDAGRHTLSAGGAVRALARRPVPFTLARELALAWPGEVDRRELILRAFRLREADDTHRARLRVEIGRLRPLVAPLARVEPRGNGYALVLPPGRAVVVLEPPVDGNHASLLALLADGAAWSTSALALALDTSQRSVQRALAELVEAGRVRAVGQARAQRWRAPPWTEFATILLLPAALPLT